jgi:DNA-binding response OmpR family regulator
VEDNEDIALLLHTTLRARGYDPVVTYTAVGALMLAGREGFDLFILDTRLGEEHGADLCREMRAAYPDTPVVFYSAAAFDADREAALGAGACAYVTKPGMEELVEEVRKVLGPGAASWRSASRRDENRTRDRRRHGRGLICRGR